MYGDDCALQQETKHPLSSTRVRGVRFVELPPHFKFSFNLAMFKIVILPNGSQAGKQNVTRGVCGSALCVVLGGSQCYCGPGYRLSLPGVQISP